MIIHRIGRKRVASEAAIYLSGTLLNRLFPFLLIPLYTRTMPAHEFGIWGFCMAALNALLILSDLGLNSATARLYYEHNDSDVATFLMTGLITRLLAAIGTALFLLLPLMAGWSWLTGNSFPALPYVPLLLACAAVQSIVSYNLAISRAMRQAGPFVRIQVVQTVLQAAAGAALVIAGFGAAGPLYGYLFGSFAVASVVGWLFVRQYLTRKPMDWQQAVESLLFGLKTIPANAAVWLRNMADRIIIGRSLSMSDLGLYQLAASGIAPMTILMGAFNNAYLPFYYEKRKQGSAALPLIAAIDMFVIFALGCLSAGVMSIAPELIRLLAPPSYSPGTTMVAPLVLSAFFGGVALQFNKELLFHKRPGTASAIAAFPAFAGVAANLLIVPLYGAMAAAWANSVVSAVILTGSIAAAQKVERTDHSLARLFGACIILTITASASSFWAPLDPFEPEALLLRVGGGATVLVILSVVLLPGHWRVLNASLRQA